MGLDLISFAAADLLDALDLDSDLSGRNGQPLDTERELFMFRQLPTFLVRTLRCFLDLVHGSRQRLER